MYVWYISMYTGMFMIYNIIQGYLFFHSVGFYLHSSHMLSFSSWRNLVLVLIRKGHITNYCEKCWEQVLELFYLVWRLTQFQFVIVCQVKLKLLRCCFRNFMPSWWPCGIFIVLLKLHKYFVFWLGHGPPCGFIRFHAGLVTTFRSGLNTT